MAAADQRGQRGGDPRPVEVALGGDPGLGAEQRQLVAPDVEVEGHRDRHRRLVDGQRPGECEVQLALRRVDRDVALGQGEDLHGRSEAGGGELSGRRAAAAGGVHQGARRSRDDSAFRNSDP